MKPPSITHHLTRAELDTAIRLYVGGQRGIDLTKANSTVRVKTRKHLRFSESGYVSSEKTHVLGAEVTIKAPF